MSKIWFVYILECADKTLYTGCTNNVGKRVLRHNEGHGAKYTKHRLPVTLEYFEQCDDHSTALKREAQIKNWSRKKKEQLIKDRGATLSVARKRHAKRGGVAQLVRARDS